MKFSIDPAVPGSDRSGYVLRQPGKTIILTLGEIYKIYKRGGISKDEAERLSEQLQSQQEANAILEE